MSEKPKILNLGCGKNILQGWINIDCVKLDGVDIVADFDKCASIPLPYENDSIDGFYASHLIEHLRNPLPFMQELHRIAKPNAEALFLLPYGSSDDAFEDPTHVRQYFLYSFGYFSQPFYWRADYGYSGDWLTNRITLKVEKKRYTGKSFSEIMYEVNSLRNIVKEMIVELTAIKPVRSPLKELQIQPEIKVELAD